MFDQFAIMGFIVGITQIIKIRIPHFKTRKGKVELAMLVVIGAGLLNVVNVIMFGTPEMSAILALKDGLDIGLRATGLYAMGTTMLDKSDWNTKEVNNETNN